MSAEPRLFALDDETTLAMQVMPDGTAYFAVPPVVQAQLDRIEAMLGELFEPKEKVTPVQCATLNAIQQYLVAAEPWAAPVTVEVIDGCKVVVKSLIEITQDSQDWVRDKLLVAGAVIEFMVIP